MLQKIPGKCTGVKIGNTRQTTVEQFNICNMMLQWQKNLGVKTNSSQSGRMSQA